MFSSHFYMSIFSFLYKDTRNVKKNIFIYSSCVSCYILLPFYSLWRYMLVRQSDTVEEGDAVTTDHSRGAVLLFLVAPVHHKDWP